VGITFSDLGYRTVDEVLRDADLAMYEAKAGGRGRVALFDSSMHEKVAEKLALENDLRHAIGDGQLSVNFQPLFELEPYRLNGFEALARWVHPQRGPVSPAVFIALAEESGHIEALTDWIINHAVGQLATWRRLHPQAGSLGMHINISGRDLARASLVSHVQAGARVPRGARFGTDAGDHRDHADGPSRRGAAERWASCANWACASPSTTSAPATRRWPT
jgi:predicted signal transduction protein with EAL and GGDEF domain